MSLMKSNWRHDCPTLFDALKDKRKEKGFPVELTYLKKKAKEAKILFDKKAKPSDIFYKIVEKMKNRNDEFCTTIQVERIIEILINFNQFLQIRPIFIIYLQHS